MAVQSTIKKDDEFDIEIVDMGSEGEGIGHADGYALFVKNALIGDRVRVKVMKAKKRYAYACLLEILRPSPDRVEPRCSLAYKCGGCQLQHWNYCRQLEFKEKRILDCLKRIGGFLDVEAVIEPIIGTEEPFHYRNKAQFPIGRDKEGNVTAGFYAGRTHSIIDTEHCYIQAEVNDPVMKIIKEFIREFQISAYDEASHTGLIRHVLTRMGFATGEVMVCIVINGDGLPHGHILAGRLSSVEGMKSISVNVNKENTNVILGKHTATLWGESFITDYIGNIRYQISPPSFYQVNPRQTERLYQTVLEFAGLTGTEVVWDLYCGIGTISLFLAQNAGSVYGVEIVPQAVEDAKVNARINGIGNVEFFTGAAEELVPRKCRDSSGMMAADVVVLDPPRKGCDATLLDTIAELAPQRIVYVSCDPATLARDARYLCENGYRLERARGCDMFPETVHVETCVLLSHKNS